MDRLCVWFWECRVSEQPHSNWWNRKTSRATFVSDAQQNAHLAERQWAEIGDVQTWIASNLHSDTFQKKNITTEWYLIAAAFLGFNDPKKNWYQARSFATD
jgi:hypothetical protein